ERRHLARELHDELGQTLTAVKLNLLNGRRLAAEPTLAERLDDSVALVEQMLQQVRALSLALRPALLDDLGLAPALELPLERPGIAIDFAAEPLEGCLPWEMETACFRVAQEALTNVVRHARARRVRVELRRQDGELRLTVSDDGTGFDVEAARERAAAGTSM